ncbi:MAG: hypothetical protein B7Z55_06750 [Planctomycetales bacterium 12-60-4]|nr:MAG: hypothetical protein B7Z55_06750 [Planctomycetales bacterium 12-60-4]
MRYLVQALSVFAIAVGVGMLVAGGTAAPKAMINAENGHVIEMSMTGRDAEFLHYMAICLKGFGAGFLTLGVFGLILPWADVVISSLRSQRTMSTSVDAAHNPL